MLWAGGLAYMVHVTLKVGLVEIKKKGEEIARG